ncbi:hypothetical protein [Arthrobacter sp. Soil763]|uniref:hypothetical protein n=1 Tax=Arthrobacter sp. Soil763 TaxID=1736402 RepID=UPI0006FE85E4|nr:hypothetical protein [Arthrobacter sp. Soil763]KRE79982.1 hypothetical protein ASG71_08075 [Arthrobacter sp. Soil763]
MNTNSSPNFQQLVMEHKKDDSFEAISKRAGGVPKARALQSIVKDGFTRMPSQETIAGLSRALRLSPRELVLAAARTLGIDVGDDQESDLVLYGAGRLPQESKDVLRNTAAELLNWQEGRRGGASQEADNVVQFPAPKKSRPDFERMAGNTEAESEGKHEAARASRAGEESQELE